PAGPHFDHGGPRERMRGGYPDGRIEGGALDDAVAADLLLRLGKGPVGDQHLAVTDMDDSGLGGRAERAAVHHDPALGHLVHPRLDGDHHRRVLVRRHLGGLIDPEHQHVLHVSPITGQPAQSRPRGRARTCMRSPCGPNRTSSSAGSVPAAPNQCGTRVSNSAASPAFMTKSCSASRSRSWPESTYIHSYPSWLFCSPVGSSAGASIL